MESGFSEINQFEKVLNAMARIIDLAGLQEGTAFLFLWPQRIALSVINPKDEKLKTTEQQ